MFLDTLTALMCGFIPLEMRWRQFILFEIINQVELLLILKGSGIQKLLIKDGLSLFVLTLLLGNWETLGDDVLLKVLADHLTDGGILCNFDLKFEVFMQLVLLLVVTDLVGRSKRRQ